MMSNLPVHPQFDKSRFPALRARINEELAKSNFDFFFIELNLICI